MTLIPVVAPASSLPGVPSLALLLLALLALVAASLAQCVEPVSYTHLRAHET